MNKNMVLLLCKFIVFSVFMGVIFLGKEGLSDLTSF